MECASCRKKYEYKNSSIYGTVVPGFEAVRQKFEDLFDQGYDNEAQLCIYVNNKVVVDLWGYSEGFKIDGHSLNVIWSSGKSIASILMAKMVEDGNLNLDEKICTYWPEFA